MRILVLADIHSYLSQLTGILEEVDFDLVMIAGDLTHYRADDVLKIDSILSRYTDEVFAVHGNCDFETSTLNVYDSLKFLHAKSIDAKDFIVHGVGGSTYTPFNTPTEYSEEEMESFVNKLEVKSSMLNILLSHSPPLGIVDETMSGERAGSVAIRKRLSDFDLVLCGHIHESPGVERVVEGKREVIVVNPGPAAWGRFALVDVDDGIRAKLGKVV